MHQLIYRKVVVSKGMLKEMDLYVGNGFPKCTQSLLGGTVAHSRAPGL